MITVVTPCGSSIATGTGTDWLALQREMGDEIAIGPVMGAMHPDQLIHAADVARANGSTHLGLIEHDMRYPSDCFRQLLRREKWIIGATYWQRQKDQWTAIANEHADCPCIGMTGVEPVRSCGLGVMLIDVRVFDVLPEPWFTTPWMPAPERRHQGVDVYFGRHARQHGIESFVDHDLSQQVAHICGDIERWPTKLVFTQTGREMQR